MPLTLERKKELVEEISGKLSGNKECIVVNVIGLTVAEVNDLRNKLRENNVSLKVYKNRLFRRAVQESGEESGLAPLTRHLVGPSAFGFTNDDPIVAVKVLTDFAESNKRLELKAAVYEGQYWDTAEVINVAKLGSMAAIYGRLIQQMKAPMNKLVHALKSPAQTLVLTLKAKVEKG